MVSATANNNVVTQTVAKDAGATEILTRYKKIADPIGNRVIGKVTADILSAAARRAARTAPASSRWAT